jgi:predicted acylesterase/phospholipase RssA
MLRALVEWDVSADLVVETSVGSLNATAVALNPKGAASSHLAEDHTTWPPAGDAHRHLLNAVSRHGHVRMQAALEAPLAAALTPVIYLPVVCLPGPAI